MEQHHLNLNKEKRDKFKSNNINKNNNRLHLLKALQKNQRKHNQNKPPQ